MKPFRLEKNYLEEIIIPFKIKYKTIQFDVEKSKQSNSLYLYLTMQETIISLRISDHTNEQPYHKYQIIISKQMTTKKICEKIDSLCKEMSIKRRYYLLKKIEKGKGETNDGGTFDD
jgi:hypothetical protein